MRARLRCVRHTRRLRRLLSLTGDFVQPELALREREDGARGAEDHRHGREHP
ncbi:MAG: hypothetical protein ACLTMP_05615 [Eggerthella lenta]